MSPARRALATLLFVLVVACALVRSPVAAAAAAGANEIDVSSRSFSFDPSKLSVSAGQAVTIRLTSTDVAHDFVVSGHGVKNKVVVKLVGKGKPRTGVLKLAKPGTYQFFCSVPGHRAAGMRGTITVS